MAMEKNWVVYILQCKDDTLYTGSTDRLQHRLQMHRSGKGAKYTRGRGPLILRYVESCQDRGHALRREHAIKNLTRGEKLALCAEYRPAEEHADDK